MLTEATDRPRASSRYAPSDGGAEGLSALPARGHVGAAVFGDPLRGGRGHRQAGPLLHQVGAFLETVGAVARQGGQLFDGRAELMSAAAGLFVAGTVSLTTTAAVGGGPLRADVSAQADDGAGLVVRVGGALCPQCGQVIPEPSEPFFFREHCSMAWAPLSRARARTANSAGPKGDDPAAPRARAQRRRSARMAAVMRSARRSAGVSRSGRRASCMTTSRRRAVDFSTPRWLRDLCTKIPPTFEMPTQNGPGAGNLLDRAAAAGCNGPRRRRGRRAKQPCSNAPRRSRQGKLFAHHRVTAAGCGGCVAWRASALPC